MAYLLFLVKGNSYFSSVVALPSFNHLIKSDNSSSDPAKVMIESMRLYLLASERAGLDRFSYRDATSFDFILETFSSGK